jgi:iron-sulfur cluster assembly accessory protein
MSRPTFTNLLDARDQGARIDAGAIASDDEEYVYEPAGVPSFRVVSDPKSLLYIYGMQLDFSSALIGGGFNFTNPNATQTCGCGSSFAV